MEQFELIISISMGGVGLLAALYYLSQKLRFSSKCPHCGERLPERAARRGVMRYTPTKAYFCCGRRFYQISLKKSYSPQLTQSVQSPNTQAAFQNGRFGQ